MSLRVSAAFSAWLLCALATARAAEFLPAVDCAALPAACTPVGAESDGVADGSIPAWKGGPDADRAAAASPLHVIDAAHADAHAARLSPGQRAMFSRYPKSWRMPVYASRRPVDYAQAVQAATAANAMRARLIAEGTGVEGARLGFPFPHPRNGAEAIWNHRLRYQPPVLVRDSVQVVPTATGAFVPIRLQETLYGPYWRDADGAEDPVLRYLQVDVQAPARLAGQRLLVHEPRAAGVPRQAWVYNPGQRRVRKAPDTAYDHPGTVAEGQRSADMFDLYSGPMDRFDWTLAGKRALLVPYDNAVLQAAMDDPTLIRAGHLDPAQMRYELHRVWVVEARVKAGLRHQMPHRTYYLDEDSWQILLVDHYDAAGKLWRYSEAATTWDAARGWLWTVRETHYDLQNGRYVSTAYKPGHEPAQLEAKDFSPAALRGR